MAAAPQISMRPPEIPLGESARIADLYTYGILNTAAEKIFDEITALASVICGTRFAGISFIDQDRQWFKASHGVKLGQSPRSESVCAHAILENDIFEVENVHEDDRFFDSPMVRGNPRFRFYAGSPLFSDRGNAIGMLCVLDSEPGKLSTSNANRSSISPTWSCRSSMRAGCSSWRSAWAAS